MPALTPEALDFTNRHALDTDLAERVAHIVEAEWFNDRGYKFHTQSILHLVIESTGC
jgi:hypothetical protein